MIKQYIGLAVCLTGACVVAIAGFGANCTPPQFSYFAASVAFTIGIAIGIFGLALIGNLNNLDF